MPGVPIRAVVVMVVIVLLVVVVVVVVGVGLQGGGIVLKAQHN